MAQFWIRIGWIWLFLAWPGFGLAAENPVLSLAFSELEPWKTTDGSGYGGAYTEIVRELARRTGNTLNILPCPLKRCLLLIEQGQADIIIGVRATPARAKYIHFLSTPYRKQSSDKVFYVQKGKAHSIQSYQDLSRVRIGVKNGVEYFARFDNDPNLSKESVGSLASNFKKLLLGRLDAVIIAEDQGEALISRLGIRDQVEKAVYREPDPGPRAIGIAKKSRHASDPEQLKKLEHAMQSMVRDGTLKALFQRHYFEAWHVPQHTLPIE